MVPSNQNDHIRKKKSITMSFRLDDAIVYRLQEKSQRDDVTLNSLINHILKRYLDWDMYFESKSNMIPVTKPVVKEIFGRMSKQEIIEISLKIAKDAIFDIALFMKDGKMNPSSFISWFLSRMKNCSDIKEVLDKDTGMNIFVFKHELGENWSLYHKTVVESIFQDIFKEPIESSITDPTIIFKSKK